MPALWEDWPYCYFLFADKEIETEKQRDSFRVTQPVQGLSLEPNSKALLSSSPVLTLPFRSVSCLPKQRNFRENSGVVPGSSEALFQCQWDPPDPGPSTTSLTSSHDPLPPSLCSTYQLPLLFNDLLRDALHLEGLPTGTSSPQSDCSSCRMESEFWVVRERRRYFE